MTVFVSDTPGEQDKPIASWWHTILLILILLAIAARGAMFQSAPIVPNASPHNAIPLYCGLILSELLLGYAVWTGVTRRGWTICRLIGGRWDSAGRILRDVVLGLLVWGALTLLSGMWERWSPVGAPVRSISQILPRGTVEMLVWIAVSVVGGSVEEIVFRGYFLRQFKALTQRRWAALVLQAILFGVSHGYQGVSACIKITLIGLLFGAVALWRDNLRVAMIAHVWTDIASGIFRF